MFFFVNKIQFCSVYFLPNNYFIYSRMFSINKFPTKFWFWNLKMVILRQITHWSWSSYYAFGYWYDACALKKLYDSAMQLVREYNKMMTSPPLKIGRVARLVYKSVIFTLSRVSINLLFYSDFKWYHNTYKLCHQLKRIFL